MKNARQEAIISIIGSQDIETQHDLIEELREQGFKVKQATISRDIRDLGLVKEPGKTGKSHYVFNTSGERRDYNTRLLTIFRESVLSFAQAKNIVVIKTLPGLASAASSAIDSMGVDNLVGTVAGDDTAFLAMKDDLSAEKFCREITRILS